MLASRGAPELIPGGREPSWPTSGPVPARRAKPQQRTAAPTFLGRKGSGRWGPLPRLRRRGRGPLAVSRARRGASRRAALRSAPLVVLFVVLRTPWSMLGVPHRFAVADLSFMLRGRTARSQLASGVLSPMRFASAPLACLAPSPPLSFDGVIFGGRSVVRELACGDPGREAPLLDGPCGDSAALRELGADHLAARLSRFSKARNARANPDINLLKQAPSLKMCFLEELGWGMNGSRGGIKLWRHRQGLAPVPPGRRNYE